VNAARRPVAALRLALCAIAMIGLGTPVAGHAVTTSISGFDPPTQDRLARAVSQGFVAEGSPGYAVGIWRADGSHYVRAFGVSNRQTGEPLQVEDRFRVGSLTKTMTAVTVLRLVDQGRLSLDDRLSKYVPGIANGDLITVRQLLAMRAGVYDFTGNQRLMLRWWKSLTAPWHPPAGGWSWRRHLWPGHGDDAHRVVGPHRIRVRLQHGDVHQRHHGNHHRGHRQ
jgi:CubicO group peptidase (beta-lactamase class C family)